MKGSKGMARPNPPPPAGVESERRSPHHAPCDLAIVGSMDSLSEQGGTPVAS